MTGLQHWVRLVNCFQFEIDRYLFIFNLYLINNLLKICIVILMPKTLQTEWNVLAYPIHHKSIFNCYKKFEAYQLLTKPEYCLESCLMSLAYSYSKRLLWAYLVSILIKRKIKQEKTNTGLRKGILFTHHKHMLPFLQNI